MTDPDAVRWMSYGRPWDISWTRIEGYRIVLRTVAGSLYEIIDDDPTPPSLLAF